MIQTLAVLAAIALPPCPSSPNCVSTQAKDEAHAIAPMHYATSREAAMQRLLTVLRTMPRTTIVSSNADSITVEFRTRIFRFVDDAVFAFDDAAKTIHFRSASRLGYSDFGVNRKRMEEIRKTFTAETQRAPSAPPR